MNDLAGALPLHIAETERVLLRPVMEEDAEFIVQLLNDPAWLANIGDRGVRTPQEARPYIRDKIRGSYRTYGFGMYLIELLQGACPVGLCGLVKRDALPYPDIGFAFLPEFRSCGYAFESSKAVIRHADRLGLSKLLGIVKPSNVTSCRLLERLGFGREGVYRPTPDAQELALYGVVVQQVI